MFRSLEGTQRPGRRYGLLTARSKLAGISSAILCTGCLLVFAATATASANVTATTTAANGITAQGANLQGTYTLTSAGAPGSASGYSYYFEYGTTTAYGQLTNESPLANYAQSAVQAYVANLTAGTTYHFQLVIIAPDSTQTLGGDQALTTSSNSSPNPPTGTTPSPTAPPAKPTIVTGPVTAVTPTGFTASATINPEGNQTVDYTIATSPRTTSSFALGLGCAAPDDWFVDEFVCQAGSPHGYQVGQASQVLTGGGFTPQTVTLSVPFGFNNVPRVFNAPSTRWIRATPDVTLQYEAVITNVTNSGLEDSFSEVGAGLAGGIRSVTSPKTTAQAAVNTGRVTYTPAATTHCSQQQSNAQLTLNGTYTTKGSPMVMFDVGPTSRLGHYVVFMAGTNTPLGNPDDAALPATGHLKAFLFVAAHCPVKQENEALKLEVVHPGETLHYRMVADDGFGPGPALGRQRTYRVPG